MKGEVRCGIDVSDDCDVGKRWYGSRRSLGRFWEIIIGDTI